MYTFGNYPFDIVIQTNSFSSQAYSFRIKKLTERKKERT
jgi:hypothetical protein